MALTVNFQTINQPTKNYFMNRRDLIKMVSLASGAVVIGGEFFLTGCKNTDSSLGGATFSQSDIAFLDEVADTIIPTTSSPGAKAAKVGQFMTVMVNDCYTTADQKAFHDGIKKLNDAADKKYKKGFVDATPAERLELLKEIDKGVNEYNKKTSEQFKTMTPAEKTQMALDRNKNSTDPVTEKLKENPDYYYTMLKQLTLLGYFSSEIGATKALRYIETPGKFDGAFPYKKGDKAWAT